MNDMSSVIIPKSDQLNSDDLIAGPITIRIAEVKISPGTEQPVAISFDGDGGKPWKPCKSMSRVLVSAWGADAKAYVGRSLTLYRDPKVKWGGLEVGGIRISHLSDIDNAMTLALTETRANRKPFTVRPLTADNAPAATDQAARWTADYLAHVEAAENAPALETFVKSKAAKLEELKGAKPELHAQITDALAKRRASFAPADSFNDDFDIDPPGPATGNTPSAEAALSPDAEVAAASEGRDTADMGEIVTLAEACDQINAQTKKDDVIRQFDALKHAFDGQDRIDLEAAADARVREIGEG